MQIALDHLPYAARRQPVFAPRGVVATSQPLAAQAGLAALRRGGSAVDAAIAAAVTLTVVEPASCGVGGDAFALVWDGAKLHGLNGSGRAPAALSAAIARRHGPRMPGCGWLPVTVPGAPAAWRDLHARFGRLPFAELFEDAIDYAARGFPLGAIAARGWAGAYRRFEQGLEREAFGHWCGAFAPEGSTPAAGTVWRCADMAHTLEQLAASGGAALYTGALAERIDAHARATGGWLRAADLAAHASTWVEPIGTSYRGYDVFEIPPNGQGLAALLALNILEGFDLAGAPRDTGESYHLQLEAMKLAFADAHRYIADPERAAVPTAELLSKAYAAERRALIGERALLPEPGQPLKGGTVYLCAADADGMMVSFIQSTYSGFGCGVVVPGTGIALQNRGEGFSLEADHPNVLEPGKRPYHTIIPGFLMRQGEPIGPFGVMGGHMQPQGHVQMVVNTLDYGLNPQASLDAPRWSWWEARYAKVEAHAHPAIAAELAARGHDLEVDDDPEPFGRGQIIWRLPGGGYVAGSDGRGDGCAIGF